MDATLHRTAPDTDLDVMDLDVAARLFHGLSDRTRLSILSALLDGELRVTDIVAAVGTSQSNVSNHLACLRGCGLVTDRPGDRRQVFYSIARPEVRSLLAAAEALLVATGTDVEFCDNPLMTPARGADR
ncbi:ArsR/SmtB family transcription factor [Ilumatobacter coccineus]|uniref:Putative ArsR family transcriptional regulator n=1 Tax=Ilumatobacter coccineus (strain NBRC 103263 / KCTC 29153 / YM16-304) TaxID=1313172 RepID=A0A6C7EHJ9_ILUCY|nr:metalloregulator ArsR/SmtB family transcription factor [Ilumatobacter coccineus]BAN03456.1 putative ArsR family transcriptional regulator [Ilumatobacter coccineus YM16-304]